MAPGPDHVVVVVEVVVEVRQVFAIAFRMSDWDCESVLGDNEKASRQASLELLLLLPRF
jgi:hypothetical protein